MKKQKYSLASFALSKGQALSIPALELIQQRVDNIQKEITILSGFISSTISDIKKYEKSMVDAEKEEKIKEQKAKEEEELNWKDGPHYHPDVNPKNNGS